MEGDDDDDRNAGQGMRISRPSTRAAMMMAITVKDAARLRMLSAIIGIGCSPRSVLEREAGRKVAADRGFVSPPFPPGKRA